MTEQEKQIQRVMIAELQFRLASAVRLSVTLEEQSLDLPQKWSHGRHVVNYEEIALRPDQAEIAAGSLQFSTTYLMAVTMKDAIRAIVPDPKSSADENIKCAYQISRMIRNSFAHDPIMPIWSIDEDCRNKLFQIDDIISLDTHDLNGKSFDWRHYGGPLAILRLSQFVRYQILKEERRERQPFPPAKTIVYQQGDLIMKKVDNEDF